MAACIESHVTGDINKFLDDWVSGWQENTIKNIHAKKEI